MLKVSKASSVRKRTPLPRATYYVKPLTGLMPPVGLLEIKFELMSDFHFYQKYYHDKVSLARTGERSEDGNIEVVGINNLAC